MEEKKTRAVSGLWSGVLYRIGMSYTYTPIYLYSTRGTCTRLINTRQCVAHSREKVRKSASARDSHARRICLKFPRETRGLPRRRSRVAREQAADRESFVRRTRAVHVAATRLEQPPSFPPPRSLKCQIIGRTYVRSFCVPPSRLTSLPHSPSSFP